MVYFEVFINACVDGCGVCLDTIGRDIDDSNRFGLYHGVELTCFLASSRCE